ncbi:MAG TPA: hypothetical protein VNP97_09265 [Microbacterium sp.]|nr:hypothetical protein [Microbacterium sp.]
MTLAEQPNTVRGRRGGELREVRDECINLDWKIQDIVLVPVDELPPEVGGTSERQSERNLR